jgi:hypothetical protein
LIQGMADEDIQPELQRNVQRLLGRCLLRIQQYERLMKTMLAEHELAGPVEALPTHRATRVEKFSDKSLGTLVKSLFETCVVPEGFERDLLPEDKAPTDRISMGFSVRVSLEQENWSRAKAAIEELVTLRNDMCITSLSSSRCGPRRAASWLSTTSRTATTESTGTTASWWNGRREWLRCKKPPRPSRKTDTFRELLVNGIQPNGSFDWAHAGVVTGLREATQRLSVDGWTRLEEARSWVLEV